MRREQNVADGFVDELQTDLLGMGFTIMGAVDGTFGEKTQKAVKPFQSLAMLVSLTVIIVLLVAQGIPPLRPDFFVWLYLSLTEIKPAILNPRQVNTIPYR